VVYVTPLTDHVYKQLVTLVGGFTELLFTVNDKIAVFVHPEAFNEVTVYVPEAVYVVPFQR
jgi:hypothetical protein